MSIIKKIIFISLLLIGINFLLNSCCKDDAFQITGNGHIYAYDSTYNQINDVDTIKHSLIIEWNLFTEKVAKHIDFGIITSAYALTM